jgi:hypothetical protein
VADRRATLAHLRGGTVFRLFLGMSSCRICAQDLGSQEATDGAWAWPVGLDHYIEVHDTRLPEAFVATSRSSDGSVPSWLAALVPQVWLEAGEAAVPVAPEAEPTWIVEDSTWLDWAAANTPARPARDGLSLVEAQQLCRRLSHSTWRCRVNEAMGRWVLNIDDDEQTTRIYLQKCPATLLERRLLGLRAPDPTRVLEFERANTIAAEYDGAWGEARMVAAHPQAWLVWVRPPKGAWPTEAQVEESVRRAQGVGWVTFHPGNGKSFIAAPADEPTWRWLLTREREKAEEHLRGQRGAIWPWWSALRRSLFVVASFLSRIPRRKGHTPRGP